MKRPFLRAKFYETYHFAFCIRNILHDQFAYLRNLNDFYGDGAYLAFVAPFRRYSAFHAFLDFVIGSMLTDGSTDCNLIGRQEQMERFASMPVAIAEMELEVLPIEHALRYHGIPFTPFKQWLAGAGKTFLEASEDDVVDYLDDLAAGSVIDTLREQTVRETFYLLFGNRHLLMLFNRMMADQVAETIVTDLAPDERRYFRSDGVLKRVRIPQWVQRAVFYRDRGLCGFCGGDLSGNIAIWSEEHFDHMVPLAEGGLNDVTNIQLLCGTCNRKKGARQGMASSSYEDWYEMGEQDGGHAPCATDEGSSDR